MNEPAARLEKNPYRVKGSFDLLAADRAVNAAWCRKARSLAASRSIAQNGVLDFCLATGYDAPGWFDDRVSWLGVRFLHFPAILSRHSTFLVQNVGPFLSDPESKKQGQLADDLG